MKTFYLILILIFFSSLKVFSQEDRSVNINHTNSVSKTNLNLDSDYLDGTFFNKMTEEEMELLKESMSSVHNGLYVFNSTDNSLYFWKDSLWVTTLNADNLNDLEVHSPLKIYNEDELQQMYVQFHQNGIDEDMTAWIGYESNNSNNLEISNEIGTINLSSPSGVSVQNENDETALLVNGSSDIDLENGGILSINSTSENSSLAFDSNSIQSREDGESSALNIQNLGGEIRIHDNEEQVKKVIIDENGNIGLGKSPEEKLDVDGSGKMKRLIISNGSDFTDRFEKLNKNEEIEPGDVVAIINGKVYKSSTKSDPLVIGVVSGAQGLNSGLSMGQSFIADGDIEVAILGRVFVKVLGQVQAGDLLTSSDKTGYATKADETFKPGTIIGKALGKVDEDGYVLMLIMNF